MSAASQHPDDLDELRAILTADVERLAETLLGPANRAASTKRTARFGAKGSLSLELTGRKRGEWFSHEAGGGGGPFNLIMHAHGCRFAEAVEWARSWTGKGGDAPRPRPRAVEPRHDAEDQAERAAAIGAARRIAHAAEPAEGTVAGAYLSITRAIPFPPGGWTDAIRYHGPTRSLLAVATLADGSVQAVQRVRLTPTGQKAEAEPDRPVKVTNGRQDGALVRLPARPGVVPALVSTLLLAEGPENGLSVWSATGAETWIVLGVGMFQRVELPAGRRAILCRDDDRQHSPADKAVRAARIAWRKAGADVAVALPWSVRRQDKSDFNDLMREHGRAGVIARLLPFAPTPAPPPTRRKHVDEARDAADAAVSDFFKAAAAFDPDLSAAEGTAPPVHGVRVGVGIGKSHAARHHAVKLLTAIRAAGSRRNVTLAVPTHRLGSEQAELLRALPAVQAGKLKVAVWRGRAAPDPDHADFANLLVPEAEKTSMCRNLEAVFEAQGHGLNVDQTACRRVVKDGDGEKVAHECPLYSACAYQMQRSKRADLWIVPHEMLFTEKPTALGDLAAVVVDESPWQAGLEGVTGLGDRMPLDVLRGGDRRPQDAQSPDWHVLQHHRLRVLDALDDMTEGPVFRDAMSAEGLTAQEAAEARAFELKRIEDPKIYPGMSRARRAELLKQAEGNKARLQAARFWRAIEALLGPDGPENSGWAELCTVQAAEGPCKVVRLRGRKPVRKGWLVPTLLIDALLSPDLVRPFWPQIELTADIQAEAPHQRIRQVIDRSYSKSRLEPLEPDRAEADPEEARRRIRNLREARAIICREARRYPAGRVLVVAQKGVKEAMQGLGPLPRNIVLAHHNAVAGRDEWGDVAALIVLGRTAPSPAAVERLAAALTGIEPKPLPAWYPTTPKPRETPDGASIAAETDAHPDPVCEAIRWEICEGELVQIIGRGRGVNRDASRPLDVLVMTDAPLPLPVHEAIGHADLAPSPDDRMLAECGFAFETPRHAAAACPGLWAKWETAKTAMKGGKKGDFPYKDSIIGEFTLLRSDLRRVDYRRCGQGQGDAVAWFDPLTIADPEAALCALIGPLAWCRFQSDPAPPEPPKPARSSPILVRPPPSGAGVDAPSPPPRPPEPAVVQSMPAVPVPDGQAMTPFRALAETAWPPPRRLQPAGGQTPRFIEPTIGTWTVRGGGMVVRVAETRGGILRRTLTAAPETLPPVVVSLWLSKLPPGASTSRPDQGAWL